MLDGIYKAIFMGQGVGVGIIVIRGTGFCGGDGYFYYNGELEEKMGELQVAFRVKRHTPGDSSMFGRDSLEVSLTGHSSETSFYLEAPGGVFTITGEWLDNS